MSESVALAIVGSGGAGALTVGNLLLEAAAKVGCYGLLNRAVGPQIRGGEAAALLRLGSRPIGSVADRFDVLLAMDWNNVARFAAEIKLDANSIVIADPEQGEVPAVIVKSGATIQNLPMTELVAQIKQGRANMLALGIIAKITDLPLATLSGLLEKKLASKGEAALASSIATVELGHNAADDLEKCPLPVVNGSADGRWIITGNHAAALGAVRGGIRFVAAYPITPATEVLEGMASSLKKVGGRLVQAEDELASINMLIGASFGGVPSLTATSGPGLALMMESLGLAVSSETPLVVIDVMRGGPSTGIPTKSEQSDLNIGLYGMHGDAPHLLLAPNSVADCIFTCQWSVYLAEAMQTPAIVLSDQYLGQARTVIDAPGNVSFIAHRDTVRQSTENYRRYAITTSGISPMAIPGTPGCAYVADGLEHDEKGTPSSQAEHHQSQMDKRLRKIENFDYGMHWADIAGEGDIAIITWGSTTCAVREALTELKQTGMDNIRLISIRLLLPVQAEKFAAALQGVRKALIIEQCHTPQFYRYLRAHYELPPEVELLHRAGPLLFHPQEIVDKIKKWSDS